MAPSDKVGEFLAHYGKKGMKWGVRQKEPVGGSDKPEEGSAGGKKKGGTKELDNVELKKVIDRMKLEQEYVKLTTPAKAETYRKKLLKGAGQTAFNALVQHYTKKALTSLDAKTLATPVDKIKPPPAPKNIPIGKR